MAASITGRRANRRGMIVLAGSAAVTLVVAAAAWASHVDNIMPTSNYNQSCQKGGENNTYVCRTDNSTWTFFRQSSLESDDNIVVWDILYDEFEPTDLDVVHDTSPAYSGGAETDLIYKESNVPAGFDGVTWCNDPSGTYECDQHYVDIDPGGDNYSEGLTCHETGHAVGLLHGDDASPSRSNTASVLGCMRTPVPANDGWLGANQTSNINDHYQILGMR